MGKSDANKPRSVKPFVMLAVILAFSIAIFAWGYLIKTNRFFGLGEVLRPRLKDIPIVCMILPEVTEPGADPQLMSREEINQKYLEMMTENTEIKQNIEELKKQIEEKKEIEDNYKILLKEVERQSKQIAAYQKVEETSVKDNLDNEEKIKNLVKIYEGMEAGEAAKILEEIGELNISLVVDICRNMKTATFSEVMQNMNTEFAAILSERMAS